MKLRQKTVLLFTFFCFFVLILRLWNLQTKNSETLRNLQTESIPSFTTVSAKRGTIYDRNNKVLAKDRTVFHIAVTKKTPNIQLAENYLDFCGEKICHGVSFTDKEKTNFSLYSENNLAFLSWLRMLKKKGASVKNPLILAEDISERTCLFFQKHPLDGILILTEQKRVHPYPESLSHILGIVSKTNGERCGKFGLEHALELTLKGTDGKMFTKDNVSDAVKKQFAYPAISGSDVYLTIDIRLQNGAKNALKNGIEKIKNTKAGGACLVMDLSDGGILACASSPDYHLDSYGETYGDLLKNPSCPLFHRALSGLYTPGSVFKPITAAAALETGKITPDYISETLGVYKLNNQLFRCGIYKSTGKTHGKINVSQALCVSCNYFFYEIAHGMDADVLASFSSLFSFDKDPTHELRQSQAKSKVASPLNRSKKNLPWYPGDTLQASIGQSDTSVTPMNLLEYAAALAYPDLLFFPHFVKSDAYTPPVLKYRISNTTQTVIKKGLEEVCKNGTAKDAFSDFSVLPAGKTGSAQVPGGTNGIFIGYYPAENPKIAICTVLEYAGSGLAAAEVSAEVLKIYTKEMLP